MMIKTEKIEINEVSIKLKSLEPNQNVKTSDNCTKLHALYLSVCM